METLLLDEFKSNAIFRLKEGQRMILLAFNNIDEQQLWLYPQKNGLAIGNQIVHSCGNMRQYIISSLGGQSDVRKRDLEFSIQGGMSKKEVLEHLDKTLHQALEVIQKNRGQRIYKNQKSTRVYTFRSRSCTSCRRAFFLSRRSNCLLGQATYKSRPWVL